jgi:hypothetical protein
MLGYKDRSAALAIEHTNKIVPGGNGMFLPTVVIDGQVAGTWKKAVRKSGVTIELLPFFRFDPTLLEPVARRYGDFLGTAVTIKA